MSNDVRIVLSRAELAAANQGAAMRWQLARAAGVANQKRDDVREDSEIDLLGIKAEIAVAKAYHLDHNPLMFGIDAGSDMFSGSLGIDVKAAFSREGNLLFKSKAAFKADIGVLVVPGEDEQTMVIRGWVTQKRYLDTAELTYLGKTGNTLLLSHTKLSSPASLWRYLTHATMGEAA